MSTITGQEMEFSDGVEGFGLAPAWKSEIIKCCFSLLSILFLKKKLVYEEDIYQLVALKIPSTVSLGLFPGQGGIPKLKLGRSLKSLTK